MLKLKYKKTFLIFQSRTKTMPYVHSKLVVRSANQPKIQDPNIQDPKIQDPKIQDPKIQDLRFKDSRSKDI